MGYNAIQDLNLSGVRWELCEEPRKTDKLVKPTQQTFDDSQQKNTDKTIIVPAAAPITLDTVKSMVARPMDVDSLVRMVGEFNHPLRNGATNVVLPNIAKNPNGLVIITDIPSTDDDLSGTILSGSAGELTDKMLTAIGMSRDNVSIIPLCFWRTPGGRTPSREELDLVRPFIDRMIEMLKPRVIATFGTLAATELAGINLTSSHGNEIKTDNYIITPLYHPNYLLLKPSAKKDVWAVLQNIQNLLKNQ